MRDFSEDIEFLEEQEHYYAALEFDRLASSFRRAVTALREASQEAQALAAALKKYEEEEN